MHFKGLGILSSRVHGICSSYAKINSVVWRVFSFLTGNHAQLLVIAVSFLCLQLHSFDLPTPPIRFTSVRVTAKYHGIKLDYRELRHTVLDLLGQIKAKLRVWGRAFISPEAVRMLLQEWHVSSDSTARYIVTTDTRT